MNLPLRILVLFSNVLFYSFFGVGIRVSCWEASWELGDSERKSFMCMINLDFPMRIEFFIVFFHVFSIYELLSWTKLWSFFSTPP